MNDFFVNIDENEYDLVIIGGGPAGCVAAMYASRDDLKTLVVEKSAPGGSMGMTAHVENHPGFPEQMSGMELTEKYHAHAKKYGASFRNGLCTHVSMHGLNKHVYLQGREQPVCAKTLIIATGSAPRRLDIPNESRFFGKGVSSCGTCDGGFYRDKIVVSVGGGNTALEESDYLTRFAEKVYLVHRRDDFRGTKIAQRLVRENPKIELVLNSVLTSINGNDKIESVDVRNVLTAEETNIKTDGVFVFVGQIPATATFADLVDLDAEGYIIADESTQTSIPGVYAAGDVRVKEVRQIATAAADGVVAAKMAAKYLQELRVGHIQSE